MDNAKDSFKTGVEMYLDHGNPMGWKYALLLIGQSLELFLKARLFEAAADEVFEDSKNPHAGGKTVGYEEAIARLKEHGVAFSAQNENDIKLVRRLRNDVEHFQIKVDQSMVDTYVASAMRFLDDFLYDELGVNVIDLFESQESFQTFKERTKTTEEQIAEAERRAGDELPMRPKDRLLWEIVFCPECFTESVPLEGRCGPVRCHRCKAEWPRVEECVRCASAALVGEDAEFPHFCGFCT